MAGLHARLHGSYKLTFTLLLIIESILGHAHVVRNAVEYGGRQRTNIDHGWRFMRFPTNPDGLLYDQRPDTANVTDPVILKPWVLPSGNQFIKDPANRHQRPDGNAGGSVPFVQETFDDSSWHNVNLPHDWAIAGRSIRRMTPWFQETWEGSRY